MPTDLSHDDADALKVRIAALTSEMENLAKEIEPLFASLAPKLKEIGHMREEAEIIKRELERRGLKP